MRFSYLPYFHSKKAELYAIIKTKIKEVRKFAYTHKWKLWFAATLAGFLFDIFFHFAHDDNPTEWKDYAGVSLNLFKEHFWIEIFSGGLIALWVEMSLNEYGLMPRRTGERDYKNIMKEIIKPSKVEVRIIDNQFYSFYKWIDNFEDELEDILRLLPKGGEPPFKILLLHPDTFAARQRNKDLHPENVDDINSNSLFIEGLYPLMHYGLSRLQKTLEQINKNQKDDSIHGKIEVRLFQATHSISFISGDQKMNFAIMHPNRDADKECFAISSKTHLSDYYQDNFNQIWNDSRTIKLESYKYLEIITKDKDKCKFYWGTDSSSHEKPRFIHIHNPEKIHDFADKINEFNEVFEKDRRNKYKYAEFQLIHNNQIQWVSIELINWKTQSSYYEFAKDRIEKNYTDLSVSKSSPLFEIFYDHHHRINLEDGNYVKRHLGLRGYCYCPHTVFDVYLGRRMRKMLDTIYNLFEGEKFQNFIGPDKYNEDKPNRVIVPFDCKVIKGRIEVKDEIKNQDTRVQNIRNSIDTFKTLKIENNISDDEKSLKEFIESTIRADIRRINGSTFDKNAADEKSISECIALAHLIQVKIMKGQNPIDPQKDGYEESTADYTVLHMLGKKNIDGGINKLIYSPVILNEQKEYNLNTALDSFYFKKDFFNPQTKEVHKISLKSSPVCYFNDKSEDTDNNIGYRNVLAIEFFLTGNGANR